jgi:hypothetical protein
MQQVSLPSVEPPSALPTNNSWEADDFSDFDFGPSEGSTVGGGTGESTPIHVVEEPSKNYGALVAATLALDDVDAHFEAWRQEQERQQQPKERLQQPKQQLKEQHQGRQIVPKPTEYAHNPSNPFNDDAAMPEAESPNRGVMRHFKGCAECLLEYLHSQSTGKRQLPYDHY